MVRPSTYTPEIADEICRRLVCGKDNKPESLISICRDDAMPCYSAVMVWLQKHPEFVEKYTYARELQQEYRNDEIIEIADNSTNDVRMLGEVGLGIDQTAIQRARLQIDTRKWVMSKLAPKKYGDKLTQEIGGIGGKPIEYKEMSSDERKRRILELANKRGVGGASTPPRAGEAASSEG